MPKRLTQGYYFSKPFDSEECRSIPSRETLLVQAFPIALRGCVEIGAHLN
jgi:hypothetical protein